MKFVDTMTVLSAMKAALVALHLPSSYSAVADYPKAFISVEVYRQENLLKALQDLFIYDTRVCLIVPGGDTYNNKTEGRMTTSERETEIHLLIADQDYGKSQEELTGGPNAVGVIALKDLVVENFTGANFNLSQLALVPTSSDPLHLTDREREEAPGRDCWAQSFKTPTGVVRVGQPR